MWKRRAVNFVANQEAEDESGSNKGYYILKDQLPVPYFPHLAAPSQSLHSLLKQHPHLGIKHSKYVPVGDDSYLIHTKG